MQTLRDCTSALHVIFCALWTSGNSGLRSFGTFWLLLGFVHCLQAGHFLAWLSCTLAVVWFVLALEALFCQTHLSWAQAQQIQVKASSCSQSNCSYTAKQTACSVPEQWNPK